MWVAVGAHAKACVQKRTSFRSHLFPSTKWALGIELRSSDLKANVSLYSVSHKLWRGGSFYLLFSEQSWLWVTETQRKQNAAKGSRNLKRCQKMFLNYRLLLTIVIFFFYHRHPHTQRSTRSFSPPECLSLLTCFQPTDFDGIEWLRKFRVQCGF